MHVTAEITTLTKNIIARLDEHGPDYARSPHNPGATALTIARQVVGIRIGISRREPAMLGNATLADLE